MFDPSVGRWLSEDPTGFEGGDENVYRYAGNDSTNLTDPSGQVSWNPLDLLFGNGRGVPSDPYGYSHLTIPRLGQSPGSGDAGSKPLFTLKPHNDYKGLPLEVYDVLGLVYDHLLSGSPDEAVREQGAGLIGGAFRPRTFYDAMQIYCEKTYGKGWKVVPVEFRLTGVEFYPTQASGGRADKPRIGSVKYPVLSQKNVGDDPEITILQPENTNLAHFYINGFWVFKCTDGKNESPLLGIPTEGKTHTWVHAPYDKSHAANMTSIRNKFNNDPSLKWFYFGRPYDREASAMRKPGLLQISSIYRQYLITKPGNKGLDLKTIKLSDIYDGFSFPE